MFPEIFRDDVFRLETRRLWLRWPTARDESAIERFAGMEEVAARTAMIPHPYPKGGAGCFIYQSRVGNAHGSQLTFVIAPVTRAHEAIGVVSLRNEEGLLSLGYWLAPPCWGRGLMSEAVEALVDTTFQLTTVQTVHASAREDNLASRRVLEKSGFAQTGKATRHLPMRGGAHLCALYERRRDDGVTRAVRDKSAAVRPDVLPKGF